MKQTTLCYIDNGDSYLMLHRVKKKNDASHGKWIGVGGKCEADESPDECMLREVKEETGLTITRWRYRGIVTFISDTWDNEYMHLFTATEWQGEPDMGIDDEGELAWIAKTDLPIADGVGNPTINLWEGDKIFLRLLMDEQQPFFSLKLVYEHDEMIEARIFDSTGTQASRLQDIGTQASRLRNNRKRDACVPTTRKRDACVPDACVPAAPEPLHNHCRGYLPHIETKNLQFITFRLYDSLPRELIKFCKSWTDSLGEETEDSLLHEQRRKMLALIDKYEDAGLGNCFLKDPRIASLVKDALEYHDGTRYDLVAWCIMPNHVHVLINRLTDDSLSTIMHTWRSYTAKEANSLLGRKGQFWMREYFDRYIRDQRHYATTVNYILNNPVKAQLVDNIEGWPWLFGEPVWL